MSGARAAIGFTLASAASAPVSSASTVREWLARWGPTLGLLALLAFGIDGPAIQHWRALRGDHLWYLRVGFSYETSMGREGHDMLYSRHGFKDESACEAVATRIDSNIPGDVDPNVDMALFCQPELRSTAAAQNIYLESIR